MVDLTADVTRKVRRLPHPLKGSLMTITVAILQDGPSTSVGTTRTHSVRIDRPSEKGGTDEGPMGGELLLLGLGGCFMSNLLAVIKARKAAVSDVQTRVEATLEGNPKHFSAYTLRVAAHCEDRALLEKLVTIAERGCIVANSLKKAAPITLVVENHTK